jgi:hypothetical protein
VQFSCFLAIFFLAKLQCDLRIDIATVGAGGMRELGLTALGANGIIDSL